MAGLAGSLDPVGEAINVFINLKIKIIDKLGDKLSEVVGSKLRSISRDTPEMILELGLVSTLSYCLAKARIENVGKIIKVLEDGSPIDVLGKEVKEEELAYALYVYALLKYLTQITGKNIKEVAGGSDELFRYFEDLIKNGAHVGLYNMLHAYLVQFKRLCEATFKPEGR